ncbi:SMP-30/gluconolactonase/LRE family protein [Streptomyces tailanensis]|uniref:SMP-30/gluconolactonase/LRE family protein n=1 Tax=Streptomyces tailanensis TaxID=2569858 RepID=UPI00155B0B2A|nr:YncE family protein [Streptomyces tailanensis]
MRFPHPHRRSRDLKPDRRRRGPLPLLLAALLSFTWGPTLVTTAEARAVNASTHALPKLRIDVGRNPNGIAFTPDGLTAYVTNTANGTVSVIDTVENEVIHTIRVLTKPTGIAMNRSGSRAYVADSGDSAVTVIDTEHNRVRRHIVRFGGTPTGIAVDPSGLVWVTRSGVGDVVVFDPDSIENVARFRVGTTPTGIALNSSGSLAFVANSGSNNVSVIDVEADTVKSVRVHARPTGIAVSPTDGNLAYVASTGKNILDVIDASAKGGPERTDSVGVGHSPTGVAVHPEERHVFVTNRGDNNVSVVRTTGNQLALDRNVPISAGNAPTGIALFPDDPDFAYVANSGADDVSYVFLG